MCSCPSTHREEHQAAADSRRWLGREPRSGRSPSRSIDRWRQSDTGFAAGVSRVPTRDGRGLTPRPRRVKSCGFAPATDAPSSDWTPAGLTAASYVPRNGSPSGAARSSGSLWRRRGAPALRAATTAFPQPFSSITSTPRRNRSASRLAGSAAGWIEPAKRRESACFCAATATPKWRQAYVSWRLPGVDSNHQELINSQSCCRYITGDRRGRA